MLSFSEAGYVSRQICGAVRGGRASSAFVAQRWPEFVPEEPQTVIELWEDRAFYEPRQAAEAVREAVIEQIPPQYRAKLVIRRALESMKFVVSHPGAWRAP